MCRPDGFLAGVTDGGFAPRRALAADADPHGVVDEHRPVDLPSLTEFPVRDSSSIRATIVGLELTEYTRLLVVESPPQHR